MICQSCPWDSKGTGCRRAEPSPGAVSFSGRRSEQGLMVGLVGLVGLPAGRPGAGASDEPARTPEPARPLNDPSSAGAEGEGRAADPLHRPGTGSVEVSKAAQGAQCGLQGLDRAGGEGRHRQERQRRRRADGTKVSLPRCGEGGRRDIGLSQRFTPEPGLTAASDVL